MISGMTETPETRTEPTTATREPYAVEPAHRHSRLGQAAAWVIIVAGIVFIIAVIFWTGILVGAHGGGRGEHHGDGARHESENFHRGGPPMGPVWFPGGQIGPGQQGGAQQQAPSTTPAVPGAPARP
jgi:hypothetical protein